MNKILSLAVGAATMFAILVPATADQTRPFDLRGKVTVTRVVDGDSLRSGDLRIRVHGIDAPEMRQSCEDAVGHSWDCGKAARAAMIDITSKAEFLQCELRDVDRYGRLVMQCLAGQTDIGAELVRRGLAMAYRRYASDYVAEEQAAANNSEGMWQGDFQPPWDWRQTN